MLSLVGVVTAVTSAITGVVASVVDSSLSSPQEMMVKLKRRIERMMSRCFTWFPNGGLGEPNIYQNMWNFTSNERFYLEGV